jgi:hypothetical protein
MASKALRATRYVLRRLPCYLLVLKGLWLVLAAFDFYVSDYWFISELQGHSAAFCAVLLYNAYVGRACLYLWVCTLSLLGLNVLNILYYFVNYPYLNHYSAVLVLAGLLTSLIYAIRKTRHA